MKIFKTLDQQSIIDVCISIYGSLDYLNQLMYDNNLSFDSPIKAGTSIYYPDNITPLVIKIATANNISDAGLQITGQPSNVLSCNLPYSYLNISTNLPINSARWQRSVTQYGVYSNIFNGSGYSGTDTLNLVVDDSYFLDTVYWYRCVVNGYLISNSAQLTIGSSVTMQGMTYSYLVGPTYSGNKIRFTESYTGSSINWNWQYIFGNTGSAIPISSTGPYGVTFSNYNSPIMDAQNLDWRWNGTKFILNSISQYCGTVNDNIIVKNIPIQYLPLDGSTASLITLAVAYDANKIVSNTINSIQNPWIDRVKPSDYAYASTGILGTTPRIANINNVKALYFGKSAQNADPIVGGVTSSGTDQIYHTENYRSVNYSTQQLTIASLFRIDGRNVYSGDTSGDYTITCSRSDYLNGGGTAGCNVHYMYNATASNYDLYVDYTGNVGTNQIKFPGLTAGAVYTLTARLNKSATASSKIDGVLECVSNPSLTYSSINTISATNSDTFNGFSFSPCIGHIGGYPYFSEHLADVTVGVVMYYNGIKTTSECDDLRFWMKKQYGY